MRNKLSRYILAIALVFSILLTSVTFSRYHSTALPSKPGFDGDFDLTVATKTTVSSVDEFLVAIESGYANVQIAEDAPNPFVITSGVTDVSADVIIDLNGHELRRNSRDPMLDIKSGVRMTIVDSSPAQTGSFYNPVGSALMVSGGSLTVNNGTFISGPKPGDYVLSAPKDTNAIAETDFGAKILNDGGVNKASKFWVRDDTKKKYMQLVLDSETPDDQNASATVGVMPKVPSIIPGVSTDGTKQTNGNMYFETGKNIADIITDVEKELTYTVNGNQKSSTIFTEDTFLYFTIDDNTELNHHPYSKTSANFIYQYKLSKNGDEYSFIDSSNEANAITVTIFGYNDVKKAAQGVSPENVNVAVEGGKAVPDFATVKLHSGNIFVRGGRYEARFGLPETSGIFADGGYMSLDALSEKSEDSTNSPIQFSSYGSAIGINCVFKENENDASAENYISVGGGEFSAEDGNSIRVEGGNLHLNGGKFTKEISSYKLKDTTAAVSANEVITADDSHLNACIYVNGGHVLSDGVIVNDKPEYSRVTFDVYGSNLYGIYADNGTVELTGARFEFAGEDTINENGSLEPLTYDNVGVYMTGNQPGRIKITDCIFYIPSDNSAGIRVDGAGTVESYGSRFLMTGKKNVTMPGDHQHIAGIHITENAYNATQQTVVTLDRMNPADPAEDNRDTTRFYIDNVTQCYGLIIGPAPGESSVSTQTRTAAQTEESVRVNVNAAQFILGQSPNAHTDKPVEGSNEGDGICDTCGGAVNNQEASENNLSNGAGLCVNIPNAKVNIKSCFLISSGSGYSGIYVNGGSVEQIKENENDRLVLFTGVKYGEDKNAPEASGSQYKGYTNKYLTGKTYFTDPYQKYTMSNFKDNTGKWLDDAGVKGKINDLQLNQSVAYRTHGVYVHDGNVKLDSAFLAVYGNNSAAVRSYATPASTGSAANDVAPQLDEELIENIIIKDADILVYTGDLYGEKEKDADGNLVVKTYHLGSTAISTQFGSILLGKKVKSDTATGSVNVWSDSLGVTAHAGNVEIAGTLDAKTTRGTAVYVYTGEVTLTEGGIANIDSKAIPNAIWQQGEGNNKSGLVSTDSIYVENGSFYSNGDLTITHEGINNQVEKLDADGTPVVASNGNPEYYNYNDDFISSFALRVKASQTPNVGENGTANDGTEQHMPDDITAKRVVIRKATITNKVGGGVYVSGGEVVLGYRYENETTGVNVKTEGNGFLKNASGENVTVLPADPTKEFNQAKPNDNKLGSVGASWNYGVSTTGGDAVQVWGGTLNIFDGKFHAAHGNGIQVAGGTANIYGGEFLGADADGKTTAALGGQYGFKLIDGGTANVYGGDFYGGNGGAFTMGKIVTKTELTPEDKAQGYIYGGLFAQGTRNADGTINVLGSNGNGFTVFDNSEIIFGAMARENADSTDPNYDKNTYDINHGNPDRVKSTLDISKDIAHALHRYFGIPLGSASDATDGSLPGRHVQNHIDNVKNGDPDNKTPDGKCDYCDEEFHRDNYTNPVENGKVQPVTDFSPENKVRDFYCDQCGKHFHTFIEGDTVYHGKECDGKNTMGCPTTLHYDADGNGICDEKDCNENVSAELSNHKDLQYHVDVTGNGRCDNCGVTFWEYQPKINEVTKKPELTEDNKPIYVYGEDKFFILDENGNPIDKDNGTSVTIPNEYLVYHTAYENSETYVKDFRKLQVMSQSTALAISSIRYSNHGNDNGNITQATNIKVDIYHGYFMVTKDRGDSDNYTIRKRAADAEVRIFNVEIRGYETSNDNAITPIPKDGEALTDITDGRKFTYLQWLSDLAWLTNASAEDKTTDKNLYKTNRFVDNIKVGGNYTDIEQRPIMVQINGKIAEYTNEKGEKIQKEYLMTLIKGLEWDPWKKLPPDYSDSNKGGYTAWYKERVEGVTEGDPWTKYGNSAPKWKTEEEWKQTTT